MFDCKHPRTNLVWATKDSHDLQPFQRRQLRWQCTSCGHLVGGAVAHAKAEPNTPEMDEGLVRRGIEERESLWRRLEEERAARDREWHERHQAHLASPKWWSLRERVMERDGGICQGCGAEGASEVHHLTYDHMDDELLFELVAVCRQCHSRVHGG